MADTNEKKVDKPVPGANDKVKVVNTTEDEVEVEGKVVHASYNPPPDEGRGLEYVSMWVEISDDKHLILNYGYNHGPDEYFSWAKRVTSGEPVEELEDDEFDYELV